GVDGAVGRAHREREDRRRGQRAVVPRLAAVRRLAHAAVSEPRVHRVRIPRIDREALGSTAGERAPRPPAAVELVEPDDRVARRRVEAERVLSVVGHAATMTGDRVRAGVFFFLSQYLQGVREYSPLRAGIAFLPMTVVMFSM